MGWFKTKSSAQTTPDYAGLQLQTAVNTLPVPIVWGMSKIAPNVIWYSNFQTKNGRSGSHGKGFAHTASAEVTYSADLILALSEGPIEGINRIWKNQSTYTMDGLGLSFFRVRRRRRYGAIWLHPLPPRRSPIREPLMYARRPMLWEIRLTFLITILKYRASPMPAESTASTPIPRIASMIS